LAGDFADRQDSGIRHRSDFLLTSTQVQGAA
jgi:hypothetical protein